MISTVLFGPDGTLMETEELKAISHGPSVAELRPDVPEEEATAAYAGDLVGGSRREVATTFMDHFGLEEAARARTDELGEDEPWRAYVRLRLGVYEKLLEDTELLLEQRYPHNIELLREMRREGYPTALATMSHRYQVGRILAVLGLEEAFDVIPTAEDISRGKPDPEIDLLVAEKMGVPAGEFLVIEELPRRGRGSLRRRPGRRGRADAADHQRGARGGAAGLPLGCRGPRSAARRRAPAHRKRRGETEWVLIAGSSVPCCATARRRGNARL